jgi:PadR family transcriptional regulator PadR
VSEERVDIPQGMLDLLILKTLALESRHGWAISVRLRQISGDCIDIRQGSLYPALHRLERRGWIKASWGVSDNNRRAKYYELTKRGRTHLDAQVSSWRRLSAAVVQILDAG